MTPRYFQLAPETNPPVLERKSYRVVVVADAEVSASWRNKIAEWIVAAGTKYVVAWGLSCEEWHDTVDWANLERFDFGEIPDVEHIMTSWHAGEPLSEAFWFAGYCAHHPDLELDETLILHISEEPQAEDILVKYRESQVTEPED